MTNGSLPVYDVIPLIITVGFAPGDPFENILTPGKPCKASSILTGLSFSTSSPPTVDTAPEIFEAFWLTYPRTTTCSRASISSSRDIETLKESPTLYS